MRTKIRKNQPRSLLDSPLCRTIIDEAIILYTLIKSLLSKVLKKLYKSFLMPLECMLLAPVLAHSDLHNFYLISYSKAI